MARLTIKDVFPDKRGKAGKPVRVEYANAGKFGLVTEARDETMRVEITLPFPPSVNNLFFNAAHGGRVKTPRYCGWIDEAAYSVASQKPGRLVGPYRIDITAFRPDKRRRDLGNLEKPISDFLVNARIISDDSLAEKITLQWAAGGEGVKIILTKHEGIVP